MKKALLLIALLISVFCISSCKKIPDLPGSTSKSIVGKKWKLTGYTINGVDQLRETYEDCDLDDHYIYRADGHFILDEKNTTCEDQIVINGDIVKWSIDNNILYIKHEFIDNPDNNFTMECNILEISAKTLKYSITIPEDTEDTEDTGDPEDAEDSGEFDGPYMMTYTFTAQ